MLYYQYTMLSKQFVACPKKRPNLEKLQWIPFENVAAYKLPSKNFLLKSSYKLKRDESSVSRRIPRHLWFIKFGGIE